MIKTAAGIILNQNEILLVKRVENTLLFPGHWACPGGKAEANESPEDNAVREIKEETNLDFVPTELLLISYFHDRKMYRFSGNWSGNIKLQEEEITDYGWFTFHNAMQLIFAFDYLDILKELQKKSLI